MILPCSWNTWWRAPRRGQARRSGTSRRRPSICSKPTLGRVISVNCRTSDRKSTRLNSSHSQISYAVFCLKKKKEEAEQVADGWRTTNAQHPHGAVADHAVVDLT